MKKFTIIGMIIIVGIFAGLLVYVQTAPDFEPPLSAVIAASDTDSWSKTMDDLIAYLAEKDLIDVSTKALLSGGVATDAYNYSGAEFYWWDLENLSKDSMEYAAYEEMYDGGLINLWGQGTFYMPVIPNGPFGVNITYYQGDAKALEEAFRAFAKKEVIDMTSGVWLKTLDDVEAFLIEQGAIAADASRISINFGTKAEQGMSGYRYNGNVDIYWYDIPRLAEDSANAEEYWSIRETGTQVYSNGTVGYYTVNGPFVLHFYVWSPDPVPEEEQARIKEIFLTFGQE